MMRKILFPLFLLTVFAGFGQCYNVNLCGKLIKDYNDIPKGTSFENAVFQHGTMINEKGGVEERFWLETNNEEAPVIPIDKDVEGKFEFKIESIHDFWYAAMIEKTIPDVILKHGYQMDLRNDMESDALEYIAKVKSMGLDFNDPYLETYIYGLITKIAPSEFIDARNDDINLLLVDDPTMNASMYPNGTLVINTGLLSVLKSEAELVAILSHEIAHFVLNHSIDNVNKAISRQKRAAFWSGVATGLTAIAEGVVGAKTGVYTGGTATITMAAMSALISKAVIDRLGMKYNHKQEDEADAYAVKVLKILGYPESALAAALNRMKIQMEFEHRECIYFSSYKHPALVERIENLGESYDWIEPEFEKITSFAISRSALGKYADRKYRMAISLIDTNIKNNVAIVQDYIIKSKCYLAIYHEKADIEKVLTFLNSAKALNPESLEIYKMEFVTHLRLGNKEQAIVLLNEYNTRVQLVIESWKGYDYWNDCLLAEKEWVANMLIKLK